jgi:hypothetical protein
MTHPSDHLTRETSRCRKGNRCIYGFPKPITPETHVDEDGRVHFRRRSIDDLCIASHIPELIDELDCHIFVDITSTVTVFMYLYKYMFKGPDHSYFHVSNPSEQINMTTHDHPINEIKDYIDGRYLSAPEAAWRILGFHLTNKVPSVRSLSIHLPGENLPQFLKMNQHRPYFDTFTDRLIQTSILSPTLNTTNNTSLIITLPNIFLQMMNS